tara:strand:- start:505 stop:657 length:153 start_codon:yes stop_codon:yes gene_type:complete
MIMKQNKKWMLMTYYCPIHGDEGRIVPQEISRKDINKNFLDNRKPQNKLN